MPDSSGFDSAFDKLFYLSKMSAELDMGVARLEIEAAKASLQSGNPVEIERAYKRVIISILKGEDRRWARDTVRDLMTALGKGTDDLKRDVEAARAAHETLTGRPASIDRKGTLPPDLGT